MPRIRIRFERGADGWYPVLGYAAGARDLSLTLPYPLECSYLHGGRYRARYELLESPGPDAHAGRLRWGDRGTDFTVRDEWHVVDDRRVRLVRTLHLEHHPAGGGDAEDGIQTRLRFQVAPSAGRSWRPFAPSRLYGQPDTPGPEPGRVSFMDDRLSYPLIAGYDAASRTAVAIIRVVPPTFAYPPMRPRRERRFRQRTDLGSLGFSLSPEGDFAFDLYWPYFEGDTSVALDAGFAPASAFYPLYAGTHTQLLSYEVYVFDAAHFGAAAFGAFRHAASLAAPRAPRLPFRLEDAIEYRLASLQKTYREWEPDGAAFFCSFDPSRGYDTPPSGFGSQFTTIPSSDYQRIIEYGFTGRQLNAAYALAERFRGPWIACGRRVVDFFVQHCTAQSGWLYSLYDLSQRRPLTTFGDSRPALLHYGGYSHRSGNFLRTMVESASDLLLNFRWHRDHASVEPRWLATCRAFGHFLVQHQNGDGSWYRAYSPDGGPILGDRWFGTDERAAKSATMIPIAYLVSLGEEDTRDSLTFLQAARAAGDYVLSHHVAADHYQGATLDNPNVIDKEAAFYTMSALLALYDHFHEPVYLVGAERAAQLAVTWNYVWNPPFYPGTRLADLDFEVTGWGGINSIWGGGVVDIYSLFFLADLARLSELTGVPFYGEIAQLIAMGTQQLLSHPGDLMGYADIGMQPEGVGVTSQGVDDGLIAKGDTWGSLGWIYLAGTYGLARYLRAATTRSER